MVIWYRSRPLHLIIVASGLAQGHWRLPRVVDGPSWPLPAQLLFLPLNFDEYTFND